MAILSNLLVNGESRLLGKLYTNDIEIGNDLTVTGATTTTKLIVNTTVNQSRNSAINSSTGDLAVIIGTPTGKHIAMDVNEIAAKNGVTTASALWLNYGGGAVNLSTDAKIVANNGTLTAPTISNTTLTSTTATITTGNITTANTNKINNADMITTSAMDVKGKLHAVEYDLENIMDLGGSFVVAPTLIVPSSGSGTKTLTVSKSNDTTVVLTVKDPSITSTGIAGFAWANNYKVKVSGLINNTVLGTCDGYINSTNVSSNTISLTVTMDSVTVTAIATTISNYKLNIMLYNTDTSSATAVTKPLGIYLQHYELTNNPIINVWNGQTTTPKVRIGYLGGITYDGSSLGTNAQNSWGLYSDNVFLEGQIVAKGGKIAGWTIGDGYITTNSNRTTYDSTSYNGMTMTESGIGARGSETSYFNLSTGGGLTAVGATVTGVITANTGYIGGTSGWTIASQQLYSGTIGSDNSMHLATKNLGNNTSIGGRQGSDWRLTVGSHFGVTNTGEVYGNSIQVNGGTIGGFAIDTTSIHTNNVAVTSNADNSIALSSADFTRTILSTSRAGLRFAIGDKFGVTGDGVLYTDGANITNLSASNISTGTLSADIIGANSIAIGKLNDEAKQTISGSGINLYKTSTAVDGYLNGDGKSIANMSSTYRCQTSDWISVEGFSTITAQCWNPEIASDQQQWLSYCFYTSDDMSTAISGRIAKYGTAGETYLSYVGVAIPSNAKYVRVAYRRWTKGYIKVERGSLVTGYTASPDDIGEQLLMQSIESIIGTQTSNTYSWTGTSTTLSKDDIKDGVTINYFLPRSVGGSQVSATYKRLDNNTDVNTNGVVLNLTLADGTTTGNIPVWYQGYGRLTSHYGYGAIIKMTYHKDAIIYNGSYNCQITGWWVDAQYNSDTVDNRIVYFTGKTGAKGIWATSLFMEDAFGTYQNICTASDGTVTTASSGNGARTTATTKKANTNGFKVGGTIYYTGTSYNADTNITGTNTIFSSYGNVFDSRYCMNTTLTAGSLTIYKPWYLVGSISTTDGLFYLDSTWWTQTPNTTGKVYILGGGVYDSTTSYCRITLYENNEWYVYDGTRLVPYEKYASDVAAKTATNYITYINSTDGIKIHNAGDATDYLQVNSTAIKMYRNNTQKMYLDDSKLQFTNGSTLLSQLDSTSQKFYDGSGNVVASFGSDGIKMYLKGTTTETVNINNSGATFKGAINATSGFIGENSTNGFNISASAIYNPSTKSTLNSDTVDGIYIGKDGIALGQGKFKVDKYGSMTSTSGTIGGWTVSDKYLYTLNNSLYTTLKKDGDVAFAAGSPDYNSGIGANLIIGHDGSLKAGKMQNAYSANSIYSLQVYSIGSILNNSDMLVLNGSGSLGSFLSMSEFYEDEDLIVHELYTEMSRTGGFESEGYDYMSDNNTYTHYTQIYNGIIKTDGINNQEGQNIYGRKVFNNPDAFYIYGNNAMITRIATQAHNNNNPGLGFMIGNGYYAAGSATDGVITDQNGAMYLVGGCDASGYYLRSYPTYQRKYTASANMHITDMGTIGRATSSSIRYKHDVEYYTNKDSSTIDKSKILITKKKSKEYPQSILNIPIVTFKYNEGYVTGEADFDYEKPILGLIAEDVAKICPECATYIKDDDGNEIPEAWDEKAVLVRLLYVVQKQNEMIKELQKEVQK